jgi:hypothetical protein
VKPLVPGWLLAAETRKAIERHTEWDGPAEFLTLHWDGQRLRGGLLCVIMPDISPDAYPLVMGAKTAELIAEDHDNRPCAYLLRVEAHGLAEPGPDASRADRARFTAARRWRTFHAQPGAVETCVAWCADTDGRLWTAAKRRDDPDAKISQRLYAPGDPVRLGGQLIDALRHLAADTTTGRKARP